MAAWALGTCLAPADCEAAAQRRRGDPCEADAWRSVRRLLDAAPSALQWRSPFGACAGRQAPPEATRPPPQRRIEDLMLQLFTLQDLNSNGYLEEEELVELNESIAWMHYGQAADLDKVRARYRDLFRSRLAPDGRPVSYRGFRLYLRMVLDAIDDTPMAQEMILEQFVAEAASGRKALAIPLCHCSAVTSALCPSGSFEEDWQPEEAVTPACRGNAPSALRPTLHRARPPPGGSADADGDDDSVFSIRSVSI